MMLKTMDELQSLRERLMSMPEQTTEKTYLAAKIAVIVDSIIRLVNQNISSLCGDLNLANGVGFALATFVLQLSLL